MNAENLKLATQQARLQSAQFVFGLDPLTPVSIDLAAAALGRSLSGFRSDVSRRPEALPKLTRFGGRIFVCVGDLKEFIQNPPPHKPVTPGARRRGRPTKAEQIRNQQQKGVNHA